jgi:FkbM family methyltransferase
VFRVIARIPFRQLQRFSSSALRAYIRFAPWAIGKRWLWWRVIDPYCCWNSHPFVAKTIFGMRIGGDAKDIIQQYIYYFGVWEPHITSWISSCLRPGDGFVDVGANIGYYSLLASRLVGGRGNVVAIEASPRTFSDLQRNLTLNGITNVRAINSAASAHSGKLRIFRGHEFNTGMTTIFEQSGFELEGEVVAAPLSDLIKPNEFKTARIVKIDVEGAESLVVTGMQSMLSAGRDDLEYLIEINPAALAGHGTSPNRILKPFLDAGFYAYEIENDYSPLSYMPTEAPKRPQRIRSSIIERTTDVVLSHLDKEYL